MSNRTPLVVLYQFYEFASGFELWIFPLAVPVVAASLPPFIPKHRWWCSMSHHWLETELITVLIHNLPNLYRGLGLYWQYFQLRCFFWFLFTFPRNVSVCLWSVCFPTTGHLIRVQDLPTKRNDQRRFQHRQWIVACALWAESHHPWRESAESQRGVGYRTQERNHRKISPRC